MDLFRTPPKIAWGCLKSSHNALQHKDIKIVTQKSTFLAIYFSRYWKAIWQHVIANKLAICDCSLKCTIIAMSLIIVKCQLVVFYLGNASEGSVHINSSQIKPWHVQNALILMLDAFFCLCLSLPPVPSGSSRCCISLRSWEWRICWAEADN